jgi:hypothetical protein
MYAHEEHLPPAAYPISNPNLQRAGDTPAALAAASNTIKATGSTPAEEVPGDILPADPGFQGRQDAHITTILRQMSLGHLLLGCALLIGSVILEAALRQPAFFGMAASGGMLSACGITWLAINRRPPHQLALGFYLLPYADFAIVSLWLLLFGVASPVALFYAYVIVSAALFLGSRHALALTLITAATIVTVSLEQFQNQIIPAITLPVSGQVAFNLLFTMLALGLITYAATLFSNNLDRFIIENNRQIDHLARVQAQIAGQRQQLDRELELLNDTFVRFNSGETHVRVPVGHGMLVLAGQQMNLLFEQIEQFLRARRLTARMEERIAELNQALERLVAGDLNALQAISTPSSTSLDGLTLALVRVIRQIAELQQIAQRARGDYAASMSLASELTLVRQSMNGTSAAIRELLSRSAQSAVQLRAMIETNRSSAESHYAERPFLREMELRARQQNAGLELLHARLEHVLVQLEATEAELRRLAEQGELTLRGQRVARTTLPIGLAPEQARLLSAGAQVRAVSGTLAGARSTSGPLNAASPPIRSDSEMPGSGPLQGNETPRRPRRFVSPMMAPSHPEQAEPHSWTMLPESETEGEQKVAH